jgi:hypothetical protein
MGLYPKALEAVLAGVPWGPESHCYIVDPQHGDDDNDGKRWSKPLKTLEAAEDLCVTNHNDVVVFVGGPTADNPAASITWDKSYTHLIGLSSDVYGVGQRCRVVMQAATAVTPVITVSGSGCVFKNMQFNQEKATGAASGVAIVTGERNFFENCFFMCPTSATAASYSLKVGGGENVFKRCTIGQHTNVRSAATYGLWLYVGDDNCHRNKFVDCEFLSWASGGGTAHALVYVDVDIDVEVFTAQFENCLFANVGAATLAVAIDDNCATLDHRLIVRHHADVLGCTAVADPLTYVYVPDADDSVSGLLMIPAAEA